MGAALLAVVASLCYGVGDFFGGVSSRRVPVVSVLGISQLAGLLVVVGWLAASGDAFPGWSALAASAGAGIAGVCGLAALYRGFTTGAIGIVAPISAVAPAIPLAADVARGMQPAPLQWVGIAVAIAGVVLVSYERVPGGTRTARGVGYAVVAALAFGLYFLGLGAGSAHSAAWATTAARGMATLIAVTAVLLLRAPVRIPRATVPAVVSVGVFDTAGNILLAIALAAGPVGIVATLGSLYALVTVALAQIVLGERASRLQRVGGIVAISGAALIAAG